MREVAILAFKPLVGWRIVAKSYTDKPGKFGIGKIGHLKLLRVVTSVKVIPGRFVDPRTL